MLNTKLIAISVAIVAAMGAIMPIGMRIMFGPRVGTRWIQNWPSASTFMLSSYPLAVGLFVATWRKVDPIPATTTAQVPAIAALIFALAIALYKTYDDFMSEDVASPLILNFRSGKAITALRHERELRRMTPKKALQSGRAKEYAHLVRKFGNLRGARERGNWLAAMLFVINLHGALFLATLLWYVTVVAFTKATGAEVRQPLIVTTVLFCSWFFFRGYAQWYQYSIYKPNWMNAQRIYVAIFILAICGTAAAFWLDRKFPTLALSAFLVGTWGFIKAAEKFNWQWAKRLVGGIADWVKGCRFSDFVVIYAGLIVLFSSIASSALAPPATQVQQAGKGARDSSATPAPDKR